MARATLFPSPPAPSLNACPMELRGRAHPGQHWRRPAPRNHTLVAPSKIGDLAMVIDADADPPPMALRNHAHPNLYNHTLLGPTTPPSSPNRTDKPVAVNSFPQPTCTLLNHPQHS